MDGMRPFFLSCASPTPLLTAVATLVAAAVSFCRRYSSSRVTAGRRRAARFLTHRWDHLMMHHRVAGLPRATNPVENTNKQLQLRYKTIEGFQHRSRAMRCPDAVIAQLRQKPATDCRGKRKHLRGKSRLGGAKIRHLHLDRIRNYLNTARC